MTYFVKNEKIKWPNLYFRQSRFFFSLNGCDCELERTTKLTPASEIYK